MPQRASKFFALPRLGMATPPPFVGRQDEIAILVQDMDSGGHAVMVVQGAVGAGKSRLAHEVMERVRETRPEAKIAHVRCLPGDRGIAVWSRFERAMNLLPGALSHALCSEPWVLVLDDAHLLGTDAARTLAALAPDNASGRLLLFTRDALPLRRSLSRLEMTLEGLDPDAARALWRHLEETYGPAPAGACEQALERTRGMPLALRREYARAAYGQEPGHDAWDTAALDEHVQAALQAMAVVRVAVAPAAIAAMVPGVPAESALAELVVRQLVDPQDDGRFGMHDVVRDQMLAAMDPGRRSELERAAAELIMGMGSASGPRPAWEAGDDGALGPMDPVERMREAALHLVAAGEPERAIEHLLATCERGFRRGGSGEVLALIQTLRNQDETAHAALGSALDALHACIAARRGRVAEALEIWVNAPPRRDSAFYKTLLEPGEVARLCYRGGDVDGARRQLELMMQDRDPDQRCLAVATLVDIELACGHAHAAENLATSAFERDRADISEAVRARLHMALATIYEHAGRIGAARAALSRAAGSGNLDAGLAALIEARRSVCLAWEGRLSEAETVLAQAERAAREIDAEAVADEIEHCRALVAMRRGHLAVACDILHRLVSKRRRLGDEIGALAVEIDLTRALVRRGEIARAAELVSACVSSATRHGLHGLVAGAHRSGALIDVAEMRLDSARSELAQVVQCTGARAADRASAAVLDHLVRAWQGEDTSMDDLNSALGRLSECCDDIDAGRARAYGHLVQGNMEATLAAARNLLTLAERAGRAAELAEFLALSARLRFARGDKPGAQAAATRALRDAEQCGFTAARVHALLVLAAVARDQGDTDTALTHIHTAGAEALAAGLSIERLVAAEAGEAIAGADSQDIRSAASATLTPSALAAVARMLADLGLTSERPYRVVLADGAESFCADANPERLRLTGRSLAIDGVRELIIRDGETVADLRRRTLLKRLLFLFARAPGHTFSKEDIVQKVWELEYHPLRHDAALFTNIMRIRRLLGEDGAEILRVSENGYRFAPPRDFIYIENAGNA